MLYAVGKTAAFSLAHFIVRSNTNQRHLLTHVCQQPRIPGQKMVHIHTHDISNSGIAYNSLAPHYSHLEAYSGLPSGNSKLTFSGRRVSAVVWPLHSGSGPPWIRPLVGGACVSSLWRSCEWSESCWGGKWRPETVTRSSLLCSPCLGWAHSKHPL